MPWLRVALCQVDLVVGDLDGNVDRVVAWLRRAEETGSDIAVFPELTITGYPPEDLVMRPGFVDANRRALDRVVAATGSCAAVVGFVDEDRDLYNAAAVCADGEIVGIAHKQLLPNYLVFDEKRYFAPGTSEQQVFVVRDVPVGVSICEDAWSPDGPIHALAAGGADLILNLNASPFSTGKAGRREELVATRAADASSAIAYVNLVGAQDELVFDGGSFVVDRYGELVARANTFDEELLVADVEVRPVWRKRLLDPRDRPIVAPLERIALSAAPDGRSRRPDEVLAPVADHRPTLDELWAALRMGTAGYVAKNGFTDVVIGLSGGIDSSLVAAIAADALGPDRVHGVLMPSRYSSDHSVADALSLAENLDIETRTIEIEPAHAAFEEMLEPSFAELPAGLAEENVQSRVRGVLLMALSNKLGWLVLTTSNKSESAVGYATLYGDTAGGYSVIKDVPKVTVYELCAWHNERSGREMVPTAVLNKKPSAELRPDQFDDQSLPQYDVLDPILAAYVEHDRSIDELVDDGVRPRDRRTGDSSRRPRRVQTPPDRTGAEVEHAGVRPRSSLADHQRVPRLVAARVGVDLGVWERPGGMSRIARRGPSGPQVERIRGGAQFSPAEDRGDLP